MRSPDRTLGQIAFYAAAIVLLMALWLAVCEFVIRPAVANGATLPCHAGQSFKTREAAQRCADVLNAQGPPVEVKREPKPAVPPPRPGPEWRGPHFGEVQA